MAKTGFQVSQFVCCSDFSAPTWEYAMEMDFVLTNFLSDLYSQQMKYVFEGFFPLYGISTFKTETMGSWTYLPKGEMGILHWLSL